MGNRYSVLIKRKADDGVVYELLVEGGKRQAERIKRGADINLNESMYTEIAETEDENVEELTT